VDDRLAEVVELCRQLLRFDTTNPGQPEQPAAEFVADALTEVGWPVTVVRGAPGRDNVVVRIPGRDRSRDALLVHSHLDVVPVNESEWTVDPFGGVERDGCLWGRGAVDMKDMAAMMLAVAREIRRSGAEPARDIVMAFVADEEMGGDLGAGLLVREHPELLAGCTEAIGEVGGFSVESTGAHRLYLVETAEKGVAWIRLRANGSGGHASMINNDNAILKIVAALQRLAGAGSFRLTAGTAEFLRRLGGADSVHGGAAGDGPPDEVASQAVLQRFGPLSRMLEASLRHTYNVTMFQAGYKENVIPASAEALVDARFLPGFEEEFKAETAGLLEGTGVEWSFERWLPAVVGAPAQSLLDAIQAALSTQDPQALLVPYTLSAGSDAKWFTRLGMACVGFTPLRLPDGFDFSAQFHAADERIPIDALTFGARTLHALLDQC
jgi:acetylornithine deacetylase/succinyl-diaminopimelate desuccinylase-like protein